MEKVNLAQLPTPIEYYSQYSHNNIYIKRDDLTDLALGGNKVRKLELFISDAIEKKSDCIVTYGSAQSNHCRLTAAAASKHGFKTVLILAESENINCNGNYFLYDLFDVEIIWTKTNKVPETIEATLSELEKRGFNPYFIQGGGHGNLGTHAYKLAFEEIIEQQEKMGVQFSYIFHASGTGTTQAGLVSGEMIREENIEIIGISVARRKERGREVIKKSILEYLKEYSETTSFSNNKLIFNDNYIGDGYADIYPGIITTIKEVAKKSGTLLDPVYTGKGFYGMLDYLKKYGISESNVLFIHTGGTPLLFNHATEFKGVTRWIY